MNFVFNLAQLKRRLGENPPLINQGWDNSKKSDDERWIAEANERRRLQYEQEQKNTKPKQEEPAPMATHIMNARPNGHTNGHVNGVEKSKREYRWWTEGEDTVIREGVANKLMDAEIAVKLTDRTSSAVAARRSSLGIRKRRPNGSNPRTDKETTNSMIANNTEYTIPPPVQLVPASQAPSQSTTIESSKNADLNEYKLILQLPNGRQVATPISKTKAEELALKIITGEL